MEIGEKIDVKQIVCRDVNPHELMQLLRNDIAVFFSWGAHAFYNLDGKGIRFAVNGHHHKGHVYIVLNGMDLFDVYYTTSKGTIVDVKYGLYFDMLVESIDRRVEYIDEYK